MKDNINLNEPLGQFQQSSNFLSDAMMNLSEQFSEIMKKSDEYLIEYVMEDTGLNRECAIKYINTYMSMDYSFDSDDGSLIMTPRLKDVTELPWGELDEHFPPECEKQLFHKEEQE